jgi:hypothetical protein
VFFLEGQITHLRREVKVLLPAAEAMTIARRLADELGESPPTRIAAVYFDAPDGALSRRAVESPHECVKLRAKAYTPDLGHAAGRIVLEVKRERNGVTTKERTWTTRAGAREAMTRAFAAWPALRPAVATTYVRSVYQRTAGWRATLDRDLAFHEASWELLERDEPWCDALRQPFDSEPSAILELKYGASELPRWLAALAAERATPYSKFVQAVLRMNGVRSVGA